MNTSAVWEKLKQVKDPELPTVSIVDMGMVKDVSVREKQMEIQLIPTFVGCPALEIIKQEVLKQLQPEFEGEIKIKFVLDIPWTSDRINDEGRENLKKMGIAPPPKHFNIGEPWVAECPYCGSPKTVMDNLFGPTACRSILYCTHCKNPFEAIKPI
ncbi:ring-1,2-phenylacetyl-CoA epoxidase subunit PaaD [Caldalkalibacillus uzonensis]|uniref:Ring-1,2-phenylacetyl-CoA epoxidase subunit PaaD n=1 Tax=Caldalkalibacillus uzonensis TaxID=353224 RepID=A0ABU0CS36_9BACI|nr:1,2-phenylacetyl-CoA epoxidase subunit PaaD [Caldalkalibacillus uzonensis]MDQ0338967.1 ring-1,2-phenylacetyl-CoA epoxidase subunit PaaD [Caldalkalibacillus uzonensis]